MTKNLAEKIECPLKIEGCTGLVSTSGGIEVEQRKKIYVARTHDGQEAFGNCGNYLQCYDWLIKQRGPERRPAEIRPEYRE